MSERPQDGIALTGLLDALRAELVEAQKIAQGQDLKFRLGNIEVELQVAVTSEDEVGGGVKFWVFNADAKEKLARQSIQTIRLQLTPEAGGRKPLNVSDKAPKPK